MLRVDEEWWEKEGGEQGYLYVHKVVKGPLK
jgi:hypothetical protein